MLERIRKTKEAGFTLIELLIVIIILGILAAIVVFAVGSTRGDSVAATCKTDVKSIILAEEAYKTKNAAYTTTKSDLTDGSKGGVLKSWPGGTTAATDDLVFGLGGTVAAPTVTIAGKGVKAAGSVNLDDSDSTVEAACAGK